MREILREIESGSVLHKPNISHNYRSNVIETLRWFCSELIFDDLKRSLAELFSAAPNCRLLECNLRSYDSEASQQCPSEILNTIPSYPDSGSSSVCEHPGSPYTIVQFDLNGISADGVAWAAKVHLAVRSGSDGLWKTILHDISLTSPGGGSDLMPWVDVTSSLSSFSGHFGDEIGLEVVAREFAHEMEKPLSTIMTSVSMIETGSNAGSASENSDPLGIIEECAIHMDSMLSDFVQASCNPELTRTKQDLTGMIAEIADELREFSDAPFVKLSRKTQSIPAEVDQSLMDHVFRYATIAIPGLLEDCDDIHVSCFRAGNTAYMKFEYKGKLAGPDILRKVVLPFNSTRDGGSGLDHTPIHTIVRAHGGKTFLRFEDNETVLTIALPIADSKRDILT
jgi:hypothetical protein